MRRKDGLPSYQIASLVDDLKNQCSLIVRGMDLFPSTHFQISVAEKMAWQEFKEISVCSSSIAQRFLWEKAIKK